MFLRGKKVGCFIKGMICNKYKDWRLKVVLHAKFVPGLVQSTEYGGRNHALLSRGIGGDLNDGQQSLT